ncbi:heptaprenylglyceryl phosphate synthase [Listeria sp. PSOL-1]|uniref:heptaprenylglyceryl phosphate synthase n=1 Tax=Listeria sp. PSOL-1 TaxID=1844999 RepID=UPI0013D22AD9|nr:heptaprenylglyceryl phosphate synthase [Listeria sp. PSOL-1]
MQHLFKIDPAKKLPPGAVSKLESSGTSGFIIGGTDNLTHELVVATYELFAETELPVYLEVSQPDIILPVCDLFLIPSVLNTNDVAWLHQKHHQVVKQFHGFLPWDKMTSVSYIILNKESKVATLTQAKTDLTVADIIAYAEIADNLFQMPVVYLEYSGIYGNKEVVRTVSEVLKRAKLWYGGGIKTKEQALEMAQFADTIVVGNIIYEDFAAALETAMVFK